MPAAHLHLLLDHVPGMGTPIGLCPLAYAVLRGDEAVVRGPSGAAGPVPGRGRCPRC